MLQGFSSAILGEQIEVPIHQNGELKFVSFRRKEFKFDVEIYAKGPDASLAENLSHERRLTDVHALCTCEKASAHETKCDRTGMLMSSILQIMIRVGAS